ncbi:MAG: hypothetical protein HOW73_20555 [Polyangiaceae bacterium]|nr:hypothetical protein [Polyangiaceae bacterium]
MPKLTARSLLASAEQTAGGTGAAVELHPDTTIDLRLDASAISGGTLAVIVETSADGTNGWAEVIPKGDDGNPAKFLSVTTPGSQLVVFPNCNKFVRVRWTLSGGTATFSVLGDSVRVYAKANEWHMLGLHLAFMAKCSDRKFDAAIREKTDITDSAVGMQMPTPLDVWGWDIRGGVLACAAAALMSVDGRRQGQDELVVARCAAYDEWLDKVAESKRKPAGAVDPTPEVDDGGAYAVSDARRGW